MLTFTATTGLVIEPSPLERGAVRCLFLAGYATSRRWTRRDTACACPRTRPLAVPCAAAPDGRRGSIVRAGCSLVGTRDLLPRPRRDDDAAQTREFQLDDADGRRDGGDFVGRHCGRRGGAIVDGPRCARRDHDDGADHARRRLDDRGPGDEQRRVNPALAADREASVGVGADVADLLGYPAAPRLRDQCLNDGAKILTHGLSSSLADRGT